MSDAMSNGFRQLASSALGAVVGTWLLSTGYAQEKPQITEPTLRPPAAESPQPTNLPPMPPPAAVSSPTAKTEQPEEAKITIRIENQPVADALKLYSELTERTVIQNPALAGVVTLVTKTPLTKSEAILALESVLWASGVALTPMGDKFVKAAAIQAVSKEGVPLSASGGYLPEADRITSQIIPLRYLDVSDSSLLDTLRQFIHTPGGTLMPLARSNSLLIIDTTLIVKRLQELLEELDKPVENRVQTYFFQLKNAEAGKAAATLQALITGAQPAPGAPAPRAGVPRPPGAAAGPTEESIVVGKVTIHSDDRTNTLIILSRPSNMEFLEKIIEALDAKVEPEIRFKSFKLQHAKADEVAELVLALTGTGGQPVIQRRASTRPQRQRLGGGSYGGLRDRTTPVTPPQPALPPVARTATPGTPGQPAAGVEKQAFVLSERARVIPDPRQGSILVIGSSEDLLLVENIIKEIDLTLAQVLIESVIVEVTMDQNTELGINILQREWQKDSNRGVGASIPSGSLSSNLLTKITGFTDPTKFGGFSGLAGLTYMAELGGLDLDVIVRASAGSSNFKVLQKPIVQSSQNEPAHVFVGETRPIITATATGIDTTSTTRSSIEQFDIGVTLDITPNITPGGLVELEVEQVVEDVTSSIIIEGNEQPIVARRELTSLVSVKDRGVVALGGLIKNTKRKSESKVPVIGDVPLLGLLFKQTRWENQRVELIVFLRPTVLRSTDAAQLEAQKMRDKFKGLDNIPTKDLPPLPKEPEPEKKQPWHAPFHPPKEKG